MAAMLGSYSPPGLASPGLVRPPARAGSEELSGLLGEVKKLRDGVSNGANALQRLRDPKGVENTQELWLTLAIIEEFVLRHGPSHFVTNCAVRHGGIVEKHIPAPSPEDSLWFSCIVHVEHHFMAAEISRAAVSDAGAGAGRTSKDTAAEPGC